MGICSGGECREGFRAASTTERMFQASSGPKGQWILRLLQEWGEFCNPQGRLPGKDVVGDTIPEEFRSLAKFWGKLGSHGLLYTGLDWVKPLERTRTFIWATWTRTFTFHWQIRVQQELGRNLILAALFCFGGVLGLCWVTRSKIMEIHLAQICLFDKALQPPNPQLFWSNYWVTTSELWISARSPSEPPHPTQSYF